MPCYLWGTYVISRTWKHTILFLRNTSCNFWGMNHVIFQEHTCHCQPYGRATSLTMFTWFYFFLDLCIPSHTWVTHAFSSTCAGLDIVLLQHSSKLPYPHKVFPLVHLQYGPWSHTPLHTHLDHWVRQGAGYNTGHTHTLSYPHTHTPTHHTDQTLTLWTQILHQVQASTDTTGMNPDMCYCQHGLGDHNPPCSL